MVLCGSMDRYGIRFIKVEPWNDRRLPFRGKTHPPQPRRSAQLKDRVCLAFIVIQGVKRNAERNPPHCLHSVCLLVAIWLHDSWKESIQSFTSAGNRHRYQEALHMLPLNILSFKSCIDIFCTLGNTRGTRKLRYRALKRFSILLCS